MIPSYFWPMFQFIPPENSTKTKGFLVFSGGVQNGYIGRNRLKLLSQSSTFTDNWWTKSGAFGLLWEKIHLSAQLEN